MATTSVTNFEVTILDNSVFVIIDNFRKQHKLANLDKICNELIKMVDFENTSKEHLYNRINELIIQGKIINKPNRNNNLYCENWKPKNWNNFFFRINYFLFVSDWVKHTERQVWKIKQNSSSNCKGQIENLREEIENKHEITSKLPATLNNITDNLNLKDPTVASNDNDLALETAPSNYNENILLSVGGCWR